MANVVDIIVLDDGDDGEAPSFSPEVKTSPSEPLPLLQAQSNAKKDGRSSENQKLFEEFVNYCSKLTVEHPEVIQFLQKCFSKADSTYLSSVEFRNTLGRCLTRVQSKQTKIYVYINELCTVLKAHSERKKVSLQTQATVPQSEKVETEISKEDTKDDIQESKYKHQIRHLEKLLRLYSQEIQKLQEKELSLEDMNDEDSTYIQESRLKQKMLKIFKKLCQLKNCPDLTGRVIEQRIQYQGTRYKDINRRLEKFINKTRDIFPDYGDILQVVQKANEKYNLGLTGKHLKSISQDAFRELGNKLQQRRHLDTVYNFGCHLTDSYKSGSDPAEHDHLLIRRLRENRSIAENQLENVIKKYAELQDEGEEEGWKNKNRDCELPSTSKSVKDSLRSRTAHSSKSDSEEDEDEESEESEVDIEEELRQSREAADEEDEEVSDNYLNEIDQKMEESADLQNSSPAGEEEGENEDSDNSGQDEEEVVQEATDKDEDQDLSLGSTSLSPEKEDLITDLHLEAYTPDPASPGHSDDAQLEEVQEDQTEQNKDHVILDVSSGSNETDPENHSSEHLESTPNYKKSSSLTLISDIVNVPYTEVKMPSSKEQGTRRNIDRKNNSETNVRSPILRVKSNRLDKCISKLAGNLGNTITTETEKSPSVAHKKEHSWHVNNVKHGSRGQAKTRTEQQSSNGKLVCVDTPTERQGSVRKMSFSHSQSANKHSDVVHLDSCSAGSNNSNGVHRAIVVSASPVNHLKRKRDMNTSTDSTVSVFSIKDEFGAHRRKRKATPQLWTGNGVSKYNGDANCKLQKLSSSFKSYSTPSEPCSDNENDLTLDLMVTCSPQVATTKTTSRRNKIDAATQCDPDEVIVLSD